MLNTINTKLFFLINSGVGQFVWLDHFFVFIASYFVQIILGLTLIWFFIVIPKKAKGPILKLKAYKDAVLLVFSLVVLWPLVEIIKGLVAFPRPSQILTGVHSLIIDMHFDSFPSLHTAFVFAAATFVYYYHKKSGILLFLLGGLVGVSRIFVGVHFPLDVICGALIGVAIPWGIISVFKPYKQ